jgi:hypothetical protein
VEDEGEGRGEGGHVEAAREGGEGATTANFCFIKSGRRDMQEDQMIVCHTPLHLPIS